MLEAEKTTERLKKALKTTFKRWREKDTATNTKAQLARLCAEIAGQDCSPQAVNGWFKTGRMDKLWMPVLEQVFGESLGFGSGLPNERQDLRGGLLAKMHGELSFPPSPAKPGPRVIITTNYDDIVRAIMVIESVLRSNDKVTAAAASGALREFIDDPGLAGQTIELLGKIFASTPVNTSNGAPEKVVNE